MDIVSKTINTLRFLSIDQVNQASSGHPGAPMGVAPIAYVLFKKIIKHNPNNRWFKRFSFYRECCSKVSGLWLGCNGKY